ncbi:MAG: hypothetical protein M3P06_21075 [Acidobacteriota bacterium]|nr:hypothetical protein [Acidobacteriota bacterium]
MMAYGIFVHEPWLDEAHSWLLARDTSMIDLLTTYLRYEGHPPLWYAIINVLTTLNLPYVMLNVTAAVIVAIGVVLLYRLDGVPLMVKVLLPFTYFIAYQYGIVARSYVLIFPLLLAIIHQYPRRSERIWTFTALLLLLCNVSVHALMIAAALTLLYIIDVWRGRQVIVQGALRRQLTALGVLILNGIALVAILWPPRDLAIKPILDYDFSPGKMYGITRLALTANLFNEPLLAFICLGVICTWLWRRGALLELLIVLGFLIPITTVYFNLWHEGLFVLVLFFGVLLGYARPARVADADSARDRRLTLGVTTIFCLVLIQHVIWTVLALSYDREAPYSGSRAAAQFIETYGLQNHRLYGAGFAVIGVQPYFEKNIFANYHPKGGYSFLDWTTSSDLYIPRRPAMKKWMDSRMRESPDFFLVSQKFSSEVIYSRALAADSRYRRIAVFPGRLFWKTRAREREYFMLYGRIDALKFLTASPEWAGTSQTSSQ